MGYEEIPHPIHFKIDQVEYDVKYLKQIIDEENFEKFTF